MYFPDVHIHFVSLPEYSLTKSLAQEYIDYKYKSYLIVGGNTE